MSAVLDVSLNVLYVQATDPDTDRSPADELRSVSPDLHITTVTGPAAALAELRRALGWQALLISPAVAEHDVLTLIVSVRRDRIPIAIVPIVDATHQDLFAAAVAAGADDVLVRRSGSPIGIRDGLTRLRHSPHLFPSEHSRRLAVLYAGHDPLVWNLLGQVPFASASRTTVAADGTCSLQLPSDEGGARADVIVIDESPGEAHPLQVLKAVKGVALDMPVVVVTAAGSADIATAALELGADESVVKNGIFRRRLIAALRHVHQRLEVTAGLEDARRRERAEWEAERRRLAERLEEADRVTAARDELAQRLEVVTIDLARTTHAFAEERSALETELRTLRSELWNEHRERETTRSTADAELTRLRALVDEERTAWAPQEQALRGEIEALRTAAETVAAEHEEERARWAEDRTTLEQARERARSALDVERAAWRGERQAIDEERQRLAKLLEEIDDRGGTERFRELEAASEQWESERIALTSQVDQLEQRLAEADDQATRERARLAALHAREQEEWRQAIDHLRDERDGIHSPAIEDDRQSTGPSHIEELQAQLDAARAEILHTDAAHQAEREAWRIERARLDERVAALESEREIGASPPATVAPPATPENPERRARSEAHARLIDTDAFAYGETSAASGELLRCNHAFARLFGYLDAHDAVTRTAGHAFPGLARRSPIEEQLRDYGRIDRLDSCVERVDGHPVRVREWARLVAGATDTSDDAIVERVLVAGPPGPSDDERAAKRLQDVGALTAAMMPELESLTHVMSAQSRQLVTQLAAFSRRQTRSPQPVDLRAVVTDAEPALARIAGEFVEFAIDVDAVSSFTALSDDVEQLMTSLVTLGRDLLPAGGSLVVEVRQRRAGSDRDPGPVLAVTASGYGVQAPGSCPALEHLAQRSGGRFSIEGETGWTVRLEVLFPLCAPSAHQGWNWLWE